MFNIRAYQDLCCILVNIFGMFIYNYCNVIKIEFIQFIVNKGDTLYFVHFLVGIYHLSFQDWSPRMHCNYRVYEQNMSHHLNVLLV